MDPLQADICDTHISPRTTDYQAVQHDVCPQMSRNEPVIRERTAITVPVQNLYVKNNQLKKMRMPYLIVK